MPWHRPSPEEIRANINMFKLRHAEAMEKVDHARDVVATIESQVRTLRSQCIHDFPEGDKRCSICEFERRETAWDLI